MFLYVGLQNVNGNTLVLHHTVVLKLVYIGLSMSR